MEQMPNLLHFVSEILEVEKSHLQALMSIKKVRFDLLWNNGRDPSVLDAQKLAWLMVIYCRGTNVRDEQYRYGLEWGNLIAPHRKSRPKPEEKESPISAAFRQRLNSIHRR